MTCQSSAMSSLSSSWLSAMPSKAARVAIGIVPITLISSGSCKQLDATLGEQLAATLIGQPLVKGRIGPERQRQARRVDHDRFGGDQVPRRVPHGDRELARFNHPAVETRGPVRECSLVELAAHLLGFARLEVHLGETLQLAKRPRHRRLAHPPRTPERPRRQPADRCC